MEIVKQIKATLLAIRTVQRDTIFTKWSLNWILNLDRSIETIQGMALRTSPGGRCAFAALNYTRSLSEPENKAVFERVALGECLNAISEANQQHGTTLKLEDFIEEADKYPDFGAVKITVRKTDSLWVAVEPSRGLVAADKERECAIMKLGRMVEEE